MKIINGVRYHSIDLSEPQLSIVLAFLEEGAHRQVRPIIDAIREQYPVKTEPAPLPPTVPKLPEGADYDRTSLHNGVATR